jgi:pimeloyl-ACP methyl ester carboxylesterase
MQIRNAVLVALSLAVTACAPALVKEQASLVDAAKAAGAKSVQARKMDDGGLLMNGKLDGRDFSVAIPWRWNKASTVFANGYRNKGLPTDIPDNPLAGDENGFYRIPYAQGFATGLSEYDKAGMGVQTGVERTIALKHLLDKLGATRSYILGGSMGGDITIALIDKYPDDFAGAMAVCGAVGGWPAEVGWATDVRAVYDYFTRGTPYELPGDKDLAHSAISAPPTLPALIALVWFFHDVKKLVAPINALFAAAAKNPGGPEDRMIDDIAAAAGTVRDLSGFVLPIALMATGMDDMDDVWGGPIYDNTAKLYASPKLSAEENAALDKGIARVKADPAALAKANQWYTPTGNFKAKLLTLYNEIDPLAPSTLHEAILKDATVKAGHADRLVQRAVPSQRKKFPTTDAEGYVHCGFTPDQVEAAWNDLRAWVEQNRKPKP